MNSKPKANATCTGAARTQCLLRQRGRVLGHREGLVGAASPLRPMKTTKKTKKTKSTKKSPMLLVRAQRGRSAYYGSEAGCLGIGKA